MPFPWSFLPETRQQLINDGTVLEAGHLLRPADIGLLAALGVSRLKVYRQPRVALLATGDELLEADQPLVPGKIRDANSYTLAALIAKLFGEEPSQQVKSEVGWGFMSAIETGRFRDCAPNDEVRVQYSKCVSEILPGLAANHQVCTPIQELLSRTR